MNLCRVLLVAAGLLIMTPAANADQCVVIGCQDECQYIPGGTSCRRRCQQQCWHDPQPLYFSEPEYTYAAAADGKIDPLRVLIAACVIGAILRHLYERGSSEESFDITEIEQSTYDAEDIRRRLEANAEEADRLIEDYRRGYQS